MGVNLRDLLVINEVSWDQLVGKKIAFDAYNILYQFLAAIRQLDGSPLTDKDGNITSHLAGLFYRNMTILQHGIKPVFVFDGQAPDEKADTISARDLTREEAKKKYEAAKAAGDFESARKYAQQTSKLTREMVAEAKELLSAMGIPWIQALGDGEAQASYMANKGLVWGVASQDYDSLLFGTPRLIRNLTVSQRKKKGSTYVSVKPEIVDLAATLNQHQLDIGKLIKVALLIGTDYNVGVKGVGPKTALKIIQEDKFEEYAKHIARVEQAENIFLKPPITHNYTLEWSNPDVNQIKEILSNRHGFSEKRVDTAFKKLQETKKKEAQQSLDKFA